MVGHYHRRGVNPVGSDGHNQASHQWYTSLYGDNMHPREWNSLNIEHTDKINYGRMNAIDRCIMTVGLKEQVGPNLRKAPIPINAFVKPTRIVNNTADWNNFYIKYILSQPETKYDTDLSLATGNRGALFVNPKPQPRGIQYKHLLRPDDGQATTYKKNFWGQGQGGWIKNA